MMSKCSVCKQMFDDSEMYEYRGVLACEAHFEQAQQSRDFQWAEIIAEERHKTDVFQGLSLGDNPVGRANRQILRPSIEIARKESGRLREYEGR